MKKLTYKSFKTLVRSKLSDKINDFIGDKYLQLCFKDNISIRNTIMGIREVYDECNKKK